MHVSVLIPRALMLQLIPGFDNMALPLDLAFSVPFSRSVVSSQASVVKWAPFIGYRDKLIVTVQLSPDVEQREKRDARLAWI